MIPILLTALMVMPPQASAHPKTDVITLNNGDHITGEIKSLVGGLLALGTDAMGTVNVEWKEVASVDSNYNYEVRLASGERFFGSVKPTTQPGSVRVKDVFGTRDLSWEEVVELRPLEDEVIDRLDVYVSANYAYTKASGVRQTEFRTTVSYEDEKARNDLTGRLTVSDTDEDSTASSRVNLSRMVWSERQHIFRTFFGGHETNDELGLDYRLTLGVGLGRFLVNTNNQSLTTTLGVQALEELSVGGERQESLEAVINARLARWRFDTPELDLRLDAQLYPSLTERDRLRADTNATLRWEILGDLYWDFSAWGSYDNAAVEEDAGEFDWGVTTGVGWSF